MKARGASERAGLSRAIRIVRRGRVVAAIGHALRNGICWIAAPAGYGKTTSVADYLQKNPALHVFYNRGGDFREHNVENIDFEIGKLNLTERQIDDLVAFLGRPLTDMRVVQQKAPFDHPQLFVPNGHPVGHDGRPRVNDEGVARDIMLEIEAVGRHGGLLPRGFLD